MITFDWVVFVFILKISFSTERGMNRNRRVSYISYTNNVLYITVEIRITRITLASNAQSNVF